MPRAATHTDLTESYESISTAREGSDAARTLRFGQVESQLPRIPQT